MSETPLRLGTRGSQLAMWQSTWVKDQLESHGIAVEIITIKTEGDMTKESLVNIGGQGLFTKRLQIALLENEIDFAVHSLKDLPTEPQPKLTVASVPEREDPRDALLSVKYSSLDELPKGASIGTGSVRRAAQLRRHREDLLVQDIRGNVDTRISKLRDGDYDAIVLACAGLLRLQFDKHISQIFEKDTVMPAVGQGAVGIETRVDDLNTINAVAKISHAPSFASAMAEREMLRKLQGGCLAPIGAWTKVNGKTIHLEGSVLSIDGKEKIQASATGAIDEPEKLGESVAKQLIELGAKKYLT